VWKPYELRPGLPPEGMSRTPKPGEQQGFPPYLLELAGEQGLKLKRSSIIPNSRPALEMAEYARAEGNFEQYHRAVFKAYWEESKNIGLKAVLREIAAACGLDADEAERSLDEHRFTEIVTKESEEAKQSGINGIPAFIVGRYLIEGAQPYEVFQKAMEQALGDGAETGGTA
jgi:predicted DsbA family dithiol-disulfide isomerase